MTTPQELDKEAHDWCEEKNGDHLDPRDFYPKPESVEAYKAGHQSAEAKSEARIRALEAEMRALIWIIKNENRLRGADSTMTFKDFTIAKELAKRSE